MLRDSMKKADRLCLAHRYDKLIDWLVSVRKTVYITRNASAVHARLQCMSICI